MKIKSQESRVKSRTMRCVAFCLALAGPSAFRSHAQCYIDPATGRQVCADAPEALAGARAPALDSRPSALDSSGHCRVSVGDGSAGSGTLVAVERSIGIVLTCSHLFDGAAGRIVVSFRNGERFGALLIERDPAHDLAALAIRRPSLAPVEVSGEEPAGALLACGYGPNGQFRCMRGNIIGRATATGAVHPSLTLSFAVRPGDSGGAVVNERDQLVGVIWGQRDGLTYATCGRPVREFLDGVFAKCAKSPGATPQIDWQARLDHLSASPRARGKETR